jgi:hypothetical protein
MVSELRDDGGPTGGLYGAGAADTEILAGLGRRGSGKPDRIAAMNAIERLRRAGLIVSLVVGLGSSITVFVYMITSWTRSSVLKIALSFFAAALTFFLSHLVVWLLFYLVRKVVEAGREKR